MYESGVREWVVRVGLERGMRKGCESGVREWGESVVVRVGCDSRV